MAVKDHTTSHNTSRKKREFAMALMASKKRSVELELNAILIMKRKSELAQRFAEQFMQEPPRISPAWERAIETYKRMKSETVTR